MTCITTDRFVIDRTLKYSMLHSCTALTHICILFAIEPAFRVIFPKLYIIYSIIMIFNGRTAALYKKIYKP